jgi:hypothetical protein
VSSGKLVLLLLLVSLAPVAPATASPIVFSSRNAFDAAFPGSVVETWDSYPFGTTFTNGATVNGITYTSNLGQAVVQSLFITTSAPNTLDFFGTSVTFTFAAPVMGFGIDISTSAGATGAFVATTNAGDAVSSVFNPFPGASTGQFIGFSSASPFKTITVAQGPNGSAFAVDTLRTVAIVPEPSSLMLLIAGGVAAVVRRRHAGRLKGL